MGEQYILTSMLLGMAAFALLTLAWLTVTHFYKVLEALGIAVAWFTAVLILGVVVMEIIKYGS